MTITIIKRSLKILKRQEKTILTLTIKMIQFELT